MPELLLELLSEEIPARMQEPAAADLAELVGRSLGEAELRPERIDAYVTPRRLTLRVQGLPAKQADVTVERRGPRVGAPQAALDGFIASLGVSDYTLEEREDRKGLVYLACYGRAGQPTPDVLVPLLGAILARFPWPKSMRWGGYGIRWVRPLRGILCTFDGEVVPLEFGPLRAGATTRGHRFPGACSDRGARLRELSPEACGRLRPARRRRAAARHRGRSGACGSGGRPPAARGPCAARGSRRAGGVARGPARPDRAAVHGPPGGDPGHRHAPAPEIPWPRRTGTAAWRRVSFWSPILPAKDGGEVIVAGNERVLRARLWDAQFFWDQDRKRPLASRVPELDGVVFHARLGSLGAKAARLEALARWMAQWVPGAQSDLAARAGLLCKADLVTGMVGEFPELQGVMGSYYAHHDNERPEIAEAIAEHYAPRGRTTAARARPPASPLRSPTSWTRSSVSSRSARSRPVRRILLRCGGRRSGPSG